MNYPQPPPAELSAPPPEKKDTPAVAAKEVVPLNYFNIRLKDSFVYTAGLSGALGVCLINSSYYVALSLLGLDVFFRKIQKKCFSPENG
jgi:hypothetical protein